MELSNTGLQLIKEFENCKLTSYRDVKGVLTIGYGHTGSDVTEGLTWTQNLADSQLVMDTLHAESAVNRLVTVSLTQSEFDALCSFVYNCGVGAFTGSTMLKLLNAGDMAEAAEEFAKWSHASGQVVAGLLRRRLAEKEEFEQ